MLGLYDGGQEEQRGDGGGEQNLRVFLERPNMVLEAIIALGFRHCHKQMMSRGQSDSINVHHYSMKRNFQLKINVIYSTGAMNDNYGKASAKRVRGQSDLSSIGGALWLSR